MHVLVVSSFSRFLESMDSSLHPVDASPSDMVGSWDGGSGGLQVGFLWFDLGQLCL